MSTYASVVISRDDATRAIEPGGQGAPEWGVTARTAESLSGTITYRDGRAEIVGHGVRRTTARSPLPEGLVRVAGGTVTTRQAAMAAGLAIEGDNTQPQQQVQAPQGPAEAPQEADQINASGEDATAIDAAHGVLAEAAEAIGPTAVSHLQAEVVRTGIVPEEVRGVSAAQLEAVAAGFIAQANTILRETGADADLLVAMLTDTEAQAARAAVFTGNDKELRSFGRRAMERLQRLPDDPKNFRELTASWPASVKVERREEDWFVTTPRWSMPWAVAVRKGLIRP